MKYTSSFLQRIFDKFRPLQIFDDGESDQDLRMMLGKAMKSVDPAFDWICEVYAESSVFIYSTYIIMGGSYQGEMKYWRRGYTLSADGKSIEIANNAIEVRPKQVWETVEVDTDMETETDNPTATAPLQAKECSCQQKENKMEVEEKKKEEIAANSNNTSTTTPATSPVTPTASTSALPLTEAQVLEAFPDLKQIVTLHRTQQATRKTELVTKLLTVQQVYSKEQLESKDVAALEEIAQLVQLTETQQPVDYSFRGAAAIDTNLTPRKLPDPWKLNKQATS